MRFVLLAAMVVLAGCSGTPESNDGGDPADANKEVEEKDGTRAPPASGQSLNVTELTSSYTGIGLGAWALNTGCGGLFMDPAGPENVGGACFPLEPGTELLEFEAQDDLFAEVGLYVRYTDQGSEGYYCNSGAVSPPTGASAVMIVVDTSCMFQLSLSAPTTGQITVTMHHP